VNALYIEFKTKRKQGVSRKLPKFLGAESLICLLIVSILGMASTSITFNVKVLYFTNIKPVADYRKQLDINLPRKISFHKHLFVGKKKYFLNIQPR
jgi:hypothetical protein